jgi:hypothetical protein
LLRAKPSTGATTGQCSFLDHQVLLARRCVPTFKVAKRAREGTQ